MIANRAIVSAIPIIETNTAHSKSIPILTSIHTSFVKRVLVLSDYWDPTKPTELIS
jgi:hypothetical protein